MSVGSATTLVKPVRTINAVITPMIVKETTNDDLTTTSGSGFEGTRSSLIWNSITGQAYCSKGTRHTKSVRDSAFTATSDS
jgi:hypothetical protein